MTWIKIANGLPTHPKILGAGPHAAWLYVCALCYCNEYLTDGRLPSAALQALVPGVKRPEILARQLVAVGLWEQVEGGWQVHDYAEHQRTADQIRRAQQADRERKRRPDSNGTPVGVPSQLHSDSSQPRTRGRERAPTPGRAAAKEVEGEEENPPLPPPQGGRRRTQESWEQEIAAYAARHFPHLEDAQRTRAVRQAVVYGKAENTEQIRAFIAEHFPADQPSQNQLVPCDVCDRGTVIDSNRRPLRCHSCGGSGLSSARYAQSFAAAGGGS
jgi:hypothetical protein